jgi:hypothetical protein
MIRALLACLLLSGCATCNQHPIACGAALSLVATSAILSIQHSSNGPAQIRPNTGIQPTHCAGDTCE